MHDVAWVVFFTTASCDTIRLMIWLYPQAVFLWRSSCLHGPFTCYFLFSHTKVIVLRPFASCAPDHDARYDTYDTTSKAA